MKKPIKIIDLFSGPGGLGEGFSACINEDGSQAFKISTSIEFEENAHATLLLRAFFRQFNGKPPKEYFDFMKGKLGETPNDELYPLFKKQHDAAKKEALCLELGKDNDKIIAAINESIGKDECILIGGPPCQAYSQAGKARNKGNANYQPEKDVRNFLYQEYLKVIAEFQPMIFVMENVKGMLSAKVHDKPIFDTIYRDLKKPSKFNPHKNTSIKGKSEYKLFSLVTPNIESNDIDRDPRDFIIKSERYAVPQKRHRVIILGIREDLAEKWDDNFLLKKHDKKISVDDVLTGLPSVRAGLSKKKPHTDKDWLKAISSIKEKTIPALSKSTKIEHKKVALKIKSILKEITPPELGQGNTFGLIAKRINTNNRILNDWYTEKRLTSYISNHETRGHIEGDLHRYLFCSAWALCSEEDTGFRTKTPKSRDYIKELAPNHANFSTGKFADRFRVQVKSGPATTITSHISKDGHSFIHPDPLQCRSLTVREAARIQTFPDNYFFVGGRTAQYTQVGNAVPPYLALQISETVRKLLNNK
jgi:DNA (cytosine-5)-methyltransferase 1